MFETLKLANLKTRISFKLCKSIEDGTGQGDRIGEGDRIGRYECILNEEGREVRFFLKVIFRGFLMFIFYNAGFPACYKIAFFLANIFQ